MATRIVVFPVSGRRWAFNALVPPESSSSLAGGAGTFKQLWHRLLEKKNVGERAELVTYYVSEKMHEKWVALGNAPVGSIRNRVHSIGQRVLSRLEPSESFLKSIPKAASKVEIVFPSSINPRLVRRRVRHVAISGTIFHRRYMYGSFALLPFTALFGVLPLPNIPLFWNLFRAHAHWRALQGSRRLLLLVADDAESWGSLAKDSNGANKKNHFHNRSSSPNDLKGAKGKNCPWVCFPSGKLERLVSPMQLKAHVIDDSTISSVCQVFDLDSTQILKWRDHKESKFL